MPTGIWGTARTRAAVCAAALLVASALTAPSAGAADPPLRVAPPSVALKSAAASYAQDNGVTVERATSVLKLQGRGADLPPALRRALGASFGQVWFDGDRFVVFVKGGAAVAPARAVLAERGLAASLVKVVDWNERDLADGMAALVDEHAEAIEQGKAAVATVRGGLELTLAPGLSRAAEAGLAGSAADAAAEHRVDVAVERSDTPLGTTEPAYTPWGFRRSGDPIIAGMAYSSSAGTCTLGFYAVAIGNYFLTAGHCVNLAAAHKTICTDGVGCTTLGVDVGGYVNSGGDAGVIASWDPFPPYPAMIDWTNPYGTYAVYGGGVSVGGGYYCHTGYGSWNNGQPPSSCGTNGGTVAVTYRDYPGIVLTLQIMRGAGLCTFRGDSGGPIRDTGNGRGIGIVSGVWLPSGWSNPAGGCGSTTGLLYTDAAPAAAALGVTIASL